MSQEAPIEARDALRQCLDRFSPVSLEGLDKVKLMNRVDAKFVFHRKHLETILSEISPEYDILEIESKRLFDYTSLYFDTLNYGLYLQHHNGKANRMKLRVRHYVDTGDVFFEVKKKIKGIRTEKFRVRLPEFQESVGEKAIHLMTKVGVPSVEELHPKVWIYYRRITLASKETEERVTIDLDLRFRGEFTEITFPELVIVEIKQARISRQSPMSTALQRMRIPEFSISKYSFAVAMLVPGIKRHLLNWKIRRIFKIIGRAEAQH